MRKEQGGKNGHKLEDFGIRTERKRKKTLKCINGNKFKK
jgi:hypothetical protein